ncbi:MAG: hemolysin [Brevundimonas sp.]|nr:MAG: hemolysin [Brevundimonas sp.]
MRMILSALAAAALAAACAPTPSPETPGTGAQQCNAEASQSLIGSHVGAVDFAAGANVRIACTTCAVTMDYNPNRLNVFFVEETGIIERVTCG